MIPAGARWFEILRNETGLKMKVRFGPGKSMGFFEDMKEFLEKPRDFAKAGGAQNILEEESILMQDAFTRIPVGS